MWDTHIRYVMEPRYILFSDCTFSLGGGQFCKASTDHHSLQPAAGSNLGLDQCPQTPTDPSACMSAFLALHLTSGSTAYLEV
jgi:hypothetical protein